MIPPGARPDPLSAPRIGSTRWPWRRCLHCTNDISRGNPCDRTVYLSRMIPLRDVIPSRTTPYVTIALIVANALVFIREITLPADAAEGFFMAYGLVPAEFSWVSL